jgi:eukaryotic-like serine/threonine-protein kinase
VNALEGGSSVGRYRIVRFLGAGAMGEVYLAEDPQIDRQLAIKTVRLVGRPQEIDDRKKRLLREARAAGRLLHPNIVTLFDAGEAEGLLYLAFELVEGVDLAGRLDADSRLSLRDVLRIARQSADALDYAHSQGIVHRDIKPSNILLDRAGRVKIADFGIAKMAGQSTELTMAGSVMGSPQYLSPEQIRGEDLDGRSDIFSLGVVIYEVLSGKRPFQGDTITSLVYQILHKELPPISELRAVPPRLEALLHRMLAKDREDRLATAGEAARELAGIEMELSDQTLSSPAAALEETFVLPRKASTGAPIPMPPMPPISPPPPWLADAPPTRSTVAASPATTPSSPRPDSLAAMAAATPMPAPTAPPPAPVQAAPLQVPVQTAPGTPPALAARPRSAKGPLIFVALFLLLVLAAVAGGGWYAYQRWVKPRLAQLAESNSASAVTPVETPAQTAQQTPPTVAVATSPSPTPAQPVPSPSSSPAPVPVQTRLAPPISGPKAGLQPAPAVSPIPAPRLPAPAPAPDRPRPHDRVPAPTTAVPPSPAAPVPAAPEPEPEPGAPAPASQAADRTVHSGLAVAFHVSPPDAFIVVDGRVIGMAEDWSGQKDVRTYTFPGPGTYLVKIKKDGMVEQKIAVEAGASAGTTPIAAQLRARAAEQIDTADLRVVRVREAVAFRVRPPTAEVLVDGKLVGLARRFSGGVLRHKEWLELSQGRHRVSIVAPGHRRQDILVEVMPTAENDRERIEIVLTQGGGGE